MKKILGLTIAALLVMGLVGGGTWAYFNDPETSTGNVLTAGTLNLTADVTGGGTVSGSVTPGADGANEFITLSTLKPGDNGTVTFTLNNTGNLPGTLTITSTATFAENGAGEPETSATTPTNNNGSNGDLDEYVGVALTQNINGAGATYLLGNATNKVKISGLEAALDAVVDLSVPAGQNVVYVLYWEIAADVKGVGVDLQFGTGDDVAADDNVLQSDTATLDLNFNLEQVGTP